MCYNILQNIVQITKYRDKWSCCMENTGFLVVIRSLKQSCYDIFYSILVYWQIRLGSECRIKLEIPHLKYIC